LLTPGQQLALLLCLKVHRAATVISLLILALETQMIDQHVQKVVGRIHVQGTRESQPTKVVHRLAGTAVIHGSPCTARTHCAVGIGTSKLPLETSELWVGCHVPAHSSSR